MKGGVNIGRLLLSALMVLSVVVSYAERPSIKARFSKDNIEVGDRVEYIIDIEKDRATQIGIPDFKGKLTPEQQKQRQAHKAAMSQNVEYDGDVFEHVASRLDTIKVEGRRLHLRQCYTLAVMETGDIHLRPSILYFEKNRDIPDTIYASDSLTLHVARYEQYDTTRFLVADPTSQMGFKVDSTLTARMLRSEGIESHKDMPFIFAEIKDYATYGIIGLVLLGFVVWFVVWLVRRYMARRAGVVRLLPQLPPHVVAIKALVELSNRKLWQNGKFKLYYTHLSDILRCYISGRWGVCAMEMTTDEIMAALADYDLPYGSRRELVEILRTADMVKFAKAEPEAELNDENYTRAYYFVENTKLVDEQRNEGKQDITIETKIQD